MKIKIQAYSSNKDAEVRLKGAELELLSDLLISGSLQHIDLVMEKYHWPFKENTD